jgi:outer membrane immunogenic protein
VGEGALKQLLVAWIAVAAIGVTPAVAADVDVRSSPDPLADFPIVDQPPLVRVHSWTGCYLGVQVGAADGSTQFNGQFVDNAVPSTFGAPTAIILTPIGSSSVGVDQFGLLAGGQVGCDVQFAPRWVIGAAADAAAANISGFTAQNGSTTVASPILPAATTSFSSNGQLNSKADFVATATGRIGYSPSEFAGQGLFYAKGGAAWVHNAYNFNGQTSTTACAVATVSSCTTFFPTVFNPFNFSGADTRVGWTVGVGLEWVIFDHWSIMAEYDYMNFGSRNVTFTDAVMGSANISISQYLNEVKLGINYRFY